MGVMVIKIKGALAKAYDQRPVTGNAAFFVARTHATAGRGLT